LEKVGKPFWVVNGVILFCVIAYLDYITGAHISLSLFYLLPIFTFAWGIKGNAGVYAAIFSAALWLWIDLMNPDEDVTLILSLWNGIVRLGFFLLPVYMLKNLEKEIAYARTDYLTNAINSRYFRYLLENEIERSARYHHPFSIAFIDLDDFKIINDTFGHTFGDDILKSIVNAIKNNLRKTDIIARMGGDEFAVLLPETNVSSVKNTMIHMKESLLTQMHDEKWHVTFSIGVLTVTGENLTLDEVLRNVDRAMYIVKNNGKNDIKYVVK